MTTATMTRPTEAICPPWCAGHEGMYQAWQNRTDGGWMRNHGNDGTSVAGAVWVGIVAEEEEGDPLLSEALVELLLDTHSGGANVDLAPEQAREVARLLVDAADRIDAVEAAQAAEARA